MAGDAEAEAVPVADVLDEVALGTEAELTPDDVVALPGPGDVVVVAVAVAWPSVDDCEAVWAGGAAESVVWLSLGAAMTVSVPPPEVDGGAGDGGAGGGGAGGGGADWPEGTTLYEQSLSS